MASCVGTLSQSITQDCNFPLVAGYTGRAMLFPLEANAGLLTRDAQNPRILADIANLTGGVAVNNVMTAPFDGSNTASNNESGFMQFLKTFTFRVPMRGANVSENIVEPIAKSAGGFLAVIEKKENTADGKFEVVGMFTGLTTNADGITRSESENGGAWLITMSSTEPFAECTFKKTDLAATMTAFNTAYNTALNE